MDDKIKVSVCITVFNEEDNIEELLESLVSQTKKPDEIVIVDSQSTDKTVEKIKKLQKGHKIIKLIVQKSSRSEGRNTAIRAASNDIIAVTDAGCIAKKDWLENITDPFKHKNTEVVAGFYKMKANSPFQKACSVFLGITPKKFSNKFLPSARSMAFRKKVWQEIGGFPEEVSETAEDTVFSNKLIKMNKKVVQRKNAQVIWQMPSDIKEYVQKMYSYARGDAKTRVFIDPSKGILSHNVKVLSIFLRYLLFIFLLIISLQLGLFILSFYISWSFMKVYSEYSNIKAGIWGFILQIVGDIAVMLGFISGLKTPNKA